MIVFKAQGGLGNQLFQYATARAMALKNECPLIVDHHWFDNPLRGETRRAFDLLRYQVNMRLATARELRQWTLMRNRWSKYLRPILPLKVLTDQCADPASALSNAEPNLYMKGFWQSEQYFVQVRPILLSELQPQEPAAAMDRYFLDQMHGSAAVSLHVRRGDYVTDANTAAYHGVCSLSYYNNAIEYIAQRITSPVFFVFSDDPQWTKENIRIPFQTYYIEHNDSGAAFQDLRLMAACKHHIIANSSFSWWGAWLSRFENQIVVSPSKWFHGVPPPTNLIPPSWIKM
jgi:hypothetical protein